MVSSNYSYLIIIIFLRHYMVLSQTGFDHMQFIFEMIINRSENIFSNDKEKYNNNCDNNNLNH